MKAAKKKPKYERSVMSYVYTIQGETFYNTQQIADKYDIARVTAIKWTKIGVDRDRNIIKKVLVTKS